MLSVRRDFRAVTLLVAFGIGLLGQAAAAMAMPMTMQMVDHAATLNTSSSTASDCPPCPQQDDSGPPTCFYLFCSIAPAILPSAPIVAPSARAIFQALAPLADAGIAVRPDLGPPRPTQHS